MQVWKRNNFSKYPSSYPSTVVILTILSMVQSVLYHNTTWKCRCQANSIAKSGETKWRISYCRQIRKKSANCADKGLIANSGADWCPKKHTKNPTISIRCFFLMGGFEPQKTVFCKYLTEYAFLWKNTMVENCSSENFLSIHVFKIKLEPFLLYELIATINVMWSEKSYTNRETFF